MTARCPSTVPPDKDFILKRNPLVWSLRDDPRFKHERQVAIDIDQTIFPLVPTIARLPGGERKRFGPFLTYECLTRHCGGQSGLQQVLEQATALEAATGAGLFHGVKESLRHLKAHGLTIHFMTHRPTAQRLRTQQFLDHFQLPYDSLTVKLSFDKAAECRRRSIFTLIDDKPETIRTAHKTGLCPLTLSWTYNQQAISDCLVPFAADWGDLTRQTLAACAAVIEPRFSAQLEENA